MVSAEEITYDIVIPSMNVNGIEPVVLKCLQTIREYSKNYCLYFVQNGDDLYDSVADELALHKNVYIIQNEDNLGFVKAVNQGLLESTSPFVVVMNNDTEAVPHWLEKLRAPLVHKYALSGPSTTTPDSWQGRCSRGISPVRLPVGHMLAFFCVMIRRDALLSVGVLDEDFGIGFGDDDNYSARAQAQGFGLVYVPEIVIPHHHRTTFKLVYSEDEIQRMQNSALTLHFDKLKGISKAIHHFQERLYREHLQKIKG